MQGISLYARIFAANIIMLMLIGFVIFSFTGYGISSDSPDSQSISPTDVTQSAEKVMTVEKFEERMKQCSVKIHTWHQAPNCNNNSFTDYGNMMGDTAYTISSHWCGSKPNTGRFWLTIDCST